MSTAEDIPETMLNRVARIIANAEECAKRGNTEDAEAAFAKADAIMTKYAIDRALVEFRKIGTEQKRQDPVSVKITFASSGQDFYDEYFRMFSAINQHNRCRSAVHGWKGEATIVGFPEDVEYTQMIWNSVHLAFASRIDPRWDASRTAEENIKILKESGRKWQYIGALANEHGFENKPNDGRLKAAYRRQCKIEGVEPTSHTQRHEAYRASYAQAFTSRIASRLRDLARAAEDEVRSSGSGTEVALRSRADNVNDWFYKMFPHLKPMTDDELKAYQAERDNEEALRLAAMTPAQRAAEERRRARERQRSRDRWERERAKMQDAAGRSAGDAAARTVDLGAGKVGPGRAAEIER